LIPLIEKLCTKSFVILYCNYDEVSNDSLFSKIIELLHTYKTFIIMNLSDKLKVIEISKDAEALLVTSGTSNKWHHLDYNLCNEVFCKSYAIQHGISQEGITRLPHYSFSADYVFTWVRGKYILDDVATPREKFIPVGVPNHYYEKTDRVDNSKVFFFTKGFDEPDIADLKLSISRSEWGGIYTQEWKNDTWNKIEESVDGECYFVRHPTCNGGELHPTLQRILNKPNTHLVDNSWLESNNLNRSQLYSLGYEYHITYPSSCFIDCVLNGLDYNLFVDYNGNVDVLTESSLEGINATDKIYNILMS